MNLHLSWQFMLIGGAIVVSILGFLIIRWQRTRSEEAITSGFRDGDKGTIAMILLLGIGFLPHGQLLYVLAGVVLALYLLFYIGRHYWLDIQENQESIRLLTPAEQRIADDTLLYARKHKKLPPQSKPTRPTRQSVRKLTNDELQKAHRTVWPYNRLDWTLIDRPNPNVPRNP